MLVERLMDTDASLHRPALEALRNQIRSSAVSLTSIPKALKFLCHQFAQLVAIYQSMPKAEDRRFLADIISVIAMTQSQPEGTEKPIDALTNTAAPMTPVRATLKFHLLGQREAIGDWGLEYVRHLAMELMEEYTDEHEQASVLLELALEIANFFLDHNGEPNACDLLYEVGRLDQLVELSTREGRDHDRVCLYLLSCVPYEADGDDRLALRIAYDIYARVADHPHALILALRLGDSTLIEATFAACADPLIRKQLAYIMARQNYRFPVPAEDAELMEIINNTHLTANFKRLGRDLEIVEPKTPDDIYKSHLQDSLRVPSTPSPKQNLAAALVNGFVNAGFGTDKLLTSAEVEADESKSWIYRVKDHGVTSTVASIGLLYLWDADVGLGKLDRYLYSENVQIKAGAVLGIGLVHVGIKNESDPALALLREYMETEESPSLLKETALIGLALAYGGSARRDVIEPIVSLVSHEDLSIATMAALAIGHVFVGSCDGDLASVILQALMERDPKDLDKPSARFFILALALIYLGRTEMEAQVVLETLQAIEHRLARDAQVLVKICSYAGSGNVLKIQELLHLCVNIKGNKADTEKSDKKDKTSDSSVEQEEEDEGQAYAVIGVALICMMEDIGKEMAHRLFTHLMHYGSPAVRKCCTPRPRSPLHFTSFSTRSRFTQ